MYNPLWVACQKNNLDMVNALLGAGAEVNAESEVSQLVIILLIFPQPLQLRVVLELVT